MLILSGRWGLNISRQSECMERNSSVDYYNGMLMWWVVWGHTITCLLQNAPSEVGIHPIFRKYDMPFFMLISGISCHLA